QQTIQTIPDHIEIAAINGPSALVLGGPIAALEQAQAAFQAQGTHTRMIAVDYASHTAQVDTIEHQLTHAFEDIQATAPTIPWYSTVQADWITSPVSPDYWYQNLRQPVRFAETVTALGRQNFTVFVESSAHPALVAAVEETLEQAGTNRAVVGGTLRRDQ